jgi:hypothetical protein
MKKQTAVEWLVEKLTETPYIDDFWGHVKQAKEMEKAQIMKTWYDCKLSIIERNPTDAEEYYKETFKSE